MTKTERCTSGWDELAQAALAVALVAGGTVIAATPAPWCLIPAMLAVGAALGIETMQKRALTKAHRCGYNAGVDEALRQLAASGAQVTRITSEGVERL
jgi:hypothetical protein